MENPRSVADTRDLEEESASVMGNGEGFPFYC